MGSKKDVNDLKRLNDAFLERINTLEAKVDAETLNTKSMLSGAELRLSERIIDKSTAPINRAVALLALLMTVVSGVVVWLNFAITDDLKEFTRTNLENKIQKWLSVDSEDSQVNDVLEEHRTRALINSHIISLARMRASRNTYTRVELTKRDRSRLLAVLKDPKSSHTNFRDALMILVSERPAFGMHLAKDDLSKTIAELVNNRLIKEDRIFTVLEILDKDASVTPLAEAILKTKGSHEVLRHQAFTVLSNSFAYVNEEQKALATAYARGLLKSSKENNKLTDAAEYFVAENPHGNDIKEYLQRVNGFSRIDRLNLKIDLLAPLAKKLPAGIEIRSILDQKSFDAEMKKLRLLLSTLIVDTIEDGSSLSVFDTLRTPHLTISYIHPQGHRYHASDKNLDDMLDDEALTRMVVTQAISRGVSMATIFSFFHARYQNNNIVSIAIDLSEDCKVQTGDGDILSTGKLWFRDSHNGELPYFLWLDEFGSKMKFEPDGLKILGMENLNLIVNADREYFGYTVNDMPPFLL